MAGFAFALSLPFEQETLLTQVAVALDRPLTPSQRRQAEVVAAYVEALFAQRWDDLLACCTKDVVYQLPSDGRPTSTSPSLSGREALRAYFTDVLSLFRPTYLAHPRVYPRPRGLIARWTSL
jgi:hypothetical protein